jgi:hypothetical protein
MFPIEKSELTKTEKGDTDEKQSQGHDHHFLWHQVDCSQGIRPGLPDSQFHVLLRHFAMTA